MDTTYHQKTSGSIRISLVIFFGIAVLIVLYLFLYSPLDYSSFFRRETTIVPSNQVTILIGGDVMLGRSVEQESRKRSDFTYPFQLVGDRLKIADITFVNLENPIIDQCKPHITGFIFCANTEMIEGLTFAGIDIVTLANNHTNNFGKEGLNQTKKHLDANGILYTGLGELEVIEKNGIKIGFIGIDKAQLGNPKLTEEEKALITTSNALVDILIVAPHWGVEYKSSPLPGVRTLAQELVTLGADVVVGSHPHWVQDREYFEVEKADRQTTIASSSLIPRNDRTSFALVNSKASIVPVYYSLGNFIFDQMWSEETKKGLVVQLTFENGKIVTEELLQTYMYKTGQPEFLEN